MNLKKKDVNAHTFTIPKHQTCLQCGWSLILGNPKAVSSASASTFGETLDSNWDHIRLYRTISCLWSEGCHGRFILYRDDVQRRVRFGFQLEVLQGARSPQSYIQSCIKNQKKPKQTWTHQKKKENMSTHLHIDRISIDMLDYHFFKFFHDGLWQLRKNQAELPCFQVILEALKVIWMHQFEALHGRFGLGTFCICFTLLNGNRL